MTGPQPIWVTGIGAVSSGGWTAEATWRTVVEGRSTARQVERFSVATAPTKVAAPVVGLEGRVTGPDSLALRYGNRAVREALYDAHVAADEIVDLLVVGNHGERHLGSPPRQRTIITPQALGRRLQRECRAREAVVVYAACASGGLAIGTAVHLLRSGRAHIAVAGGTDCLLRDLDFYQFCGLYAMSSRRCAPRQASCPFDRRRDGFVMSEGAAFLVLETPSHGAGRGAEPRAYVEGVGSSQSAYHMVASPPDAGGPSRAVAAALDDAGLEPRAVDYVNAHGTSTRDNDWCETVAIHNVFEDHAKRLLVSSSKSELGHSMAAAGSMEAVLSVRVLETGIVPPTINLEEPDPLCDLDYVPGKAREHPVRRLITNSFGFGGHNSSLVLSRAA